MGFSKFDNAANCPMVKAINRLGGKWKLVILFYLRIQPFQFGQLHQRIQGISKKVLSGELKELEADGLVQRTQAGQYVTYALTPTGQSAIPVIDAISQWGSTLAA
jgi:DNA-binding HxlR family transcriptional regulator